MISTARFVTVFALFIAFGTYLALHSDAAVPMNRSFSEFPTSHNGWKMVGESFMSDEIQRVLKASDYVSRQYAGPNGETVSLYIGYHNGGKESGAIHSPKHCLPGSGWFELSSDEQRINIAGKDVNAVKAVYQKGSEKQLFLYWFQVRNKTVAKETSLKLQEILNSALHGRKESTFVRIAVPFNNEGVRAAASGEKFVKDFYPVISTFLPQ
jgi:EpsI family protein